MSKKNSNVILKDTFKNREDFSSLYLLFKKKIHLLKNKSFLIAVSGGPDSLALTALAKTYSKEHKCKIFYVLIDHNLRKNSSKEAQSVKKLLKKNQISLYILKNKKKITGNIQSEARNIRYDLLINFCKKKRIKNILTAHNLEDQVETFFIRLSRGSGIQGLSSMKQNNKLNGNISLLRPLLEVKKSKLRKMSKAFFGKFYRDPTNKNTKYLRTRIRNLKNSIEKSGISYDQIFKSITNLASSRDTLEFYFNNIYKDLITIKKGKILIDYKKFKKLNQELKMRVLRKSITDFSQSYYSPRSKKIINLIVQIEAQKDAKLTLGGCLILKEKTRIIIMSENKSKVFY